jgi:CRP-like cAMP-binding protein
MSGRNLVAVLHELRELFSKQSKSIDLMQNEVELLRGIRKYQQYQVSIEDLLAELAGFGRADEDAASGTVTHAWTRKTARYSPGDPLSAPPDLRTRLLGLSTAVAMPRGAVLFRRDEPAFGTFLIKEGTVSLRLEGDKGDVVLDRICGPGSVVGLPANLSKSRYSMTAITLQPCQLAFVSHKNLLDSLQNDSDTGIELLKVVGGEIINLRMILAAIPTAAPAGSA